MGIDLSPLPARHSQTPARRLRVAGKRMLWRAGRGFVVRDLPWMVEKLRVIPPFEFENWAVMALGGIPNKVQVGDMGVDGRIFPVSSSAAPRKQQEGELGLKERWYPIQVKQKDKAGRPDIDTFEVTFKASGAAGYSCRKQFSTRQILNAKAPEPGGGSTVEQSDYED